MNAARVVSMDQFRGFTVAAMIVVNFLHGLDAAPLTLGHHDHFCSYADTILPGFLFAVGFSLRLSMGRRLAAGRAAAAYARGVRRSLGLILLSIVLFGVGQGYSSWPQMLQTPFAERIAPILKADLWEVLAIIGACTILVLPFIARSARIRILAALALALLHAVLCAAFNFDFVMGRPNGFDRWLGTLGRRAFDGGLLGPIAWSSIVLAGSLAHDVATALRPGRAAAILFLVGVLAAAFGYGLSCLGTLYETREAAPRASLHPVSPPWRAGSDRSAGEWLAEPPFLPPPGADLREANYWSMAKRIPTLSFLLFVTGFSFVLYGGFVAACDKGRFEIPLFRTFGQNPLAAYIIHVFAYNALRPFVPGDSPGWYVFLMLAVFFGLVWLAVRKLEKDQVFLRL